MSACLCINSSMTVKDLLAMVLLNQFMYYLLLYIQINCSISDAKISLQYKLLDYKVILAL